MFKKLTKYLLLLLGGAYLVLQIYLNMTVTVYQTRSLIPAGFKVEASMISESRVLKTSVEKDVVQDSYYIVGKYAVADLQPGANITIKLISDSPTGNSENAGGLTDEELKNYAVIFLAVDNANIYSGVQTNDLVKLSYYVEPNTSGTEAVQFQLLYGTHAQIKVVVGEANAVSGVNVLVPLDAVNEIALMKTIAKVTVIKVFADTDSQNEFLSSPGAVGDFLNGN
jgi:hypothetical protein